MPKCGGVFELDLGNVVAPFEAMKDLFEKMENEPEIQGSEQLLAGHFKVPPKL